MIASIGWMRRAFLGLPPKEASFAYRGFRGGDASTRNRIEAVLRAFLQGYNTTLEDYHPAILQARLEAMEPEVQGFAYEAGAMALSLLDLLTPWQTDRCYRYVNGSDAGHSWCGIAGRHRYMAYIGVGLALARLKRSVEPTLSRLDPFFCWLAMDGYGFHQGFFDFKTYIDARQVPERFQGYAQRAFDQGLGRSLWFVEGADVRRLPVTIGAFSPERQGDIWSGVGLACAYAGGVSAEAVRSLTASCGNYREHFAQGIAFAAMTRHQAGNPAPHTDMASRVVWGMPLAASGELAAAAMDGLVPNRDGYEATRCRIQQQFVREGMAR